MREVEIAGVRKRVAQTEHAATQRDKRANSTAIMVLRVRSIEIWYTLSAVATRCLAGEPFSNSSRVAARCGTAEMQLHSTYMQLDIYCWHSLCCRKRFAPQHAAASSCSAQTTCRQKKKKKTLRHMFQGCASCYADDPCQN